MRLVTFLHDGLSRLGAIRTAETRELVFDLNRIESRLPADIISFLELGEAARAVGEKAVSQAPAQLACELNRLTLQAPIPRPGKIIGIGQNYLLHAVEANAGASKYPIIFAKYNNTVIGPGESIVIPKLTQKVDYEGELGVVIGKRSKGVRVAEALTCVAGYTAINDISARDIQFAEMKRGFCNLGKNFDTFGPMGPLLVTPDQAGEPDDLAMELRVNGQTRQYSSTKNMVFKIRELIEFFSSMTLEPGDIITSGTPSGVAIYRLPDKDPYLLKAGDIIDSKITNLGRLQNTVVDEPITGSHA